MQYNTTGTSVVEETMQDRINFYRNFIKSVKASKVQSGELLCSRDPKKAAKLCAMIESHLSDKPKTIKELSETLNWEDPGCISRANVNRFILSYIIPTGNGASCAGLYPHQYVRAYPKTTTAEDCIKDFAPEVVIDTTCEAVTDDNAEVAGAPSPDNPSVETAESGTKLVKWYNGHQIRVSQTGMWNLTDMWRANGSDPNKRPYDWKGLPSTKEFLAKLAEKLAGEGFPPEVIRSVRDGGDTWTEGEIHVAIAFGEYLNQPFHIWVIDEAIAKVQGKARPAQQAITTTEQRLLLMLEKQAERAEEKDRLDRERQDIYLAESRANREMLGVMLATLNSLKQEQPIAPQCSPIPSQGTSAVEMGEPLAKAWYFVVQIDIEGHKGVWGWAVYGDSPYAGHEIEAIVTGLSNSYREGVKAARAAITKLNPNQQHVITTKCEFSSNAIVAHNAKKIWGPNCLFRLRAV